MRAEPQRKHRIACSIAYGAAEEDEQAEHLLEAEALFLECSKPVCATILREECAARAARLASDIPTVIPIVTDDTGEAVVDVRVTMDGVLLTQKLDASAIAVDPGTHRFSFATERGVFATQTVQVLRGQRNRRLCASASGGGRARLDAAVACGPRAEGALAPGPIPPPAANGPNPASPSGSSASGRKAPPGSAATAKEKPALGLDAVVKVDSAYVFRGYNVFQSARQSDQNLALFDQLSWDVPRTDLSFGYSSVFQLTGDNIVHNIQVGLGAEQVAFVDYDWSAAEHLTITPEIATIVYPAARQVPLFLEASGEARYVAPVDLSLYAGFFGAIRPGPLSENHFYVRPLLEKTFDLTAHLELSGQAGVGVKIFQSDPGAIHSNMFDVLVGTGLSYSFTDSLYAGARFALVWTNLERQENATTGQIVIPRFADEYVPVATLIAGGDW